MTQTLGDPTKTLTLTNADTGEHKDMSFSDAAHLLGTNVRTITDLMRGNEVAEYTHHHMIQTIFLIKRIK